MATSAQHRTAGPVFILGEDSRRTRGSDAQASNIAAGKAVADAVRTTLGPRGMDKMLVDASGNVVVTNDGVTLLEEMDIEHPAAQMLVDVARTQEDEVGDGTTTAAVFAGQLLAQADRLLEQDVHPTAVVEGYAAARDLALEAVADATLDGDLDDERLRQVAQSSMTGKGTGDVSAAALADLVVRAVRQVTDDDGVDRDDVHVHAQPGASSSATALVDGVVLDAEPLRTDGSTVELADAAVLVFDGQLGVREAETDVAYEVISVDQLTAAVDAKDAELRELADALADTGADVVFCTEKVEDAVAAALAKRGVLVYDSVSSSDAAALRAATGAALARDAHGIDDSDLGHADVVRVEAFGDDRATFVEHADADAVTLFVRGGTDHVVAELERALGDATDVVTASLDGGVVPGAGYAELAAADAVRDGAAGISGRAQLAAEAFADALDVLPRTLAANAGMDPVDAMVALRAANEDGRAGVLAVGERGELGDPVDAGVFDPADVKREAVEAATEAATMIVRIDDIIAAE